MNDNFSGQQSMEKIFKSGFSKVNLKSFGKIPELRDRFTTQFIMKNYSINAMRQNIKKQAIKSKNEIDFSDDKFRYLVSFENAG